MTEQTNFVKVPYEWKPTNNFTGCIEYPSGQKNWLLNGKLHREDGPAYISYYNSGNWNLKEWWKNGLLHRIDGPAREWSDGAKHWWLNGQLHREDGPAVINDEGIGQWWHMGKQIWKSARFVSLDNTFIIVERGIPTDDMFGKLKLTQTKLLTATGTMFVYDNLPGFKIGEGDGK